MKNNVLIFIIDDDDFDANQMGITLTDGGYRNVKVFTDPNIMLREISTEVRICIVDYRLNHVLDGFDVIDKVKEVNPSCYFIMISGMKNWSIIERFCNTVNRGRFITKDDTNLKEKLLKFVKEIVEDIQLMAAFYTQREEMQKNIEHIKKIIKPYAAY